MIVAILLAYEKSPYEGSVRPFINWAYVLKRKNYEVEFILINVGKTVIDTLIKKRLVYRIFDDLKGLSSFCRKRNYEVVFTDDYIERLKILNKIEGNFRRAVYCQVLYGIHAISAVHKPSSVKEKIIFLTVKTIPFSILRKKYKKFLGKADLIIANSRVTATILHTFYGIEPDGVVYPPVDTAVFKPYTVKKKDQVLIYLGSHTGDVDENFAKEILQILKDKDVKIFAFGNNVLKRKLSKSFKIYPLYNVSDVELAKIYSGSLVCICPQKWEQFGYVQVESMACGTPPIAFNLMGFQETIINGKTGSLVNNSDDFLKKLSQLIEKKVYIKGCAKNCRSHVLSNFSAEISTAKLRSILATFNQTST